MRLIVIVLLLIAYDILSCTTIIFSGKVTRDGRPMIWKQRDSDELNNKIMYFSDGKYSYVGLVNSKDVKGDEIWIGMNTAGFAIMNSASYNLKDDSSKLQDKEGFIMRKALKVCATVEDFQRFLDTINKPSGIEANFGVIDAYGGASYFETNNYKYKRFDLNDTKIAPYGYLIRTNYSVSGRIDEGYGYERYAQAQKLMDSALSKGKIDLKYVLQNFSRCLEHGLTGRNLVRSNNSDTTDVKLVEFQDYIPRTLTSASVLIQGVDKNEDPMQSIMWSIIGFPLTSVVYPIWLTPNVPEILTSKEKHATLCDKSLVLKKECFPIKRGNGKNYINVNKVFNNKGTGYIQLLKPLENDIFQKSIETQLFLRKNGFNEKKVEQLYKKLNDLILDEYKILFKL